MWRAKKEIRLMKYWEIIADNLSKAGWSWGCVSAVDSNGRTTWIADAHRDDGKRFIVSADEKLTAFLELESQLSKETQSIPSVHSPRKLSERTGKTRP
jgi:hypothetical protein